MKGRHFVCAAILFLFTSSAWGQNTNARVAYTDKEYTSLLACVGMTDTAWTNAAGKLKGVSLEDAKKHYDGRLEGRPKDLVLLVVNQVYQDTFTNAWDYAVSFYGDCAKNLAHVESDRSSLANYCMQNSMIGETAWEYKNSGQPAEAVYQRFAGFKSATPRTIVDQVYAGTKTRAEAGLDEWKSCMQPLQSQPSSAAPAPTPSIPPLGGLTEQEMEGMASCVVIGETVWTLAEQKSKGARLEDVKKQYEGQPDSPGKTTLLTLVDRVYADTFAGSGGYAMRYLDGCAQKKLNVAPNRMGVANSCLRNAYIAAVASSSKKSGIAAEKAYAPFAEIYGTIASVIVDKVYRSTDPEEGAVTEWKACVIASPTWTASPKGQEVLVIATPSGYQAGGQAKTDKFASKQLYPKGETPKNWTEQLSVAAFPELFDSTPTQYQKAVQGPSESCKNGKVISGSVGEEDGYAFAVWNETCDGATDGKTEFRFIKVIQGHENLYSITKAYHSEPSEAQAQQCRAYLASVRVCDSARSGQACASADAWRP